MVVERALIVQRDIVGGTAVGMSEVDMGGVLLEIIVAAAIRVVWVVEMCADVVVRVVVVGSRRD